MTELRKFRRARSSQRIELFHHGRRVAGYLDNMSLSGALLHLEEDSGIAVAELCLLRVPLPNATALPPLEVWCEAVHGGSQLVGVKFVSADAETFRLLTMLMEQMKDKPEGLDEDLERIKVYLSQYSGVR